MTQTDRYITMVPVTMKHILKQIQKRTSAQSLEYAYGELTLWVGTVSFSDTQYTDKEVQKWFQRLKRWCGQNKIDELVINWK